MDFYKGGELHFHHRNEKRFKEPRVQLYVAEIVLALEYLHSRGIMFRDLKLENIMLDINGHLRLIDFGLAKHNEKKTFTLCGTPEYMASNPP